MILLWLLSSAALLQPAVQPLRAASKVTPRARLQQLITPQMEFDALGALLADVGSTVSSDLPSFDALDLVLISPLAVPVLGFWAIRASGNAITSATSKLDAQSKLGSAQRTADGLRTRLEQSESKLSRKVAFYEEKLERDRKEAFELLRRSKGELREKLSATETKLQAAVMLTDSLQAQLKTAKEAPPPPSPPPPPPSSPSSAPPAAAASAASTTEVVKFATAAEPPASGVTLLPGVRPGDVVLVTGAGGKTGRLVVAELLRAFPGVKVRACGTESKLRDVLSNVLKEYSMQVEICNADLACVDYASLMRGVSSVVWCASSFGGEAARAETASTAPPLLQQLFAAFDVGTEPIDIGGQTDIGGKLDSAGVAVAAKSFVSASTLLRADVQRMTPKFVLLSSAAVSRLQWSASTRRQFEDAAEIPIVKLNPDDILDTKFAGEQSLRASGAPYCIVRPCSLNEDQPQGRVVLSAGDVATGRISRLDLAELLVAVLDETDALGKTFEAFALSELPKRPISSALSVLPADTSAGSATPDVATYNLLKQLAPGPGSSA